MQDSGVGGVENAHLEDQEENGNITSKYILGK
jgi:hypothetical protein